MSVCTVRGGSRQSIYPILGTISVFYGATLGAMYSEFSQALSRYTHNLLARNTLSESLQYTLLQHLGVNPWSTTESTTPCTWPLQVYPRTLSVLAQVSRRIVSGLEIFVTLPNLTILHLRLQVLLLKPQSEKEAACISIWHRLITTMVENVCNPPSTFESENEGEVQPQRFCSWIIGGKRNYLSSR